MPEIQQIAAGVRPLARVGDVIEHGQDIPGNVVRFTDSVGDLWRRISTVPLTFSWGGRPLGIHAMRDSARWWPMTVVEVDPEPQPASRTVRVTMALDIQDRDGKAVISTHEGEIGSCDRQAFLDSVAEEFGVLLIPRRRPVSAGPCGRCGGTGVVHGPGANGNWTDEHCDCEDEVDIESICHRCGGPNVVWSAPSPLWNAVMRGGSIGGEDQFDGIVCPTCFAALTEAENLAERWRFYAESVTPDLETTTPDGRVWDASAWLWVDPQQPAAPSGPVTLSLPVVPDGAVALVGGRTGGRYAAHGEWWLTPDSDQTFSLGEVLAREHGTVTVEFAPPRKPRTWPKLDPPPPLDPSLADVRTVEVDGHGTWRRLSVGNGDAWVQGQAVRMLNQLRELGEVREVLDA